MLGRNGNTAYVRYDHQGRIVPGGPIIQAKPPKNGNWQAVSNVIGTNTTSNALRAFIRIDYFNRVVPSSLVLLTKEPGDNDSHTTWIEINAQYRGNGNTTTTTTSTTVVPTTSTTTSSTSSTSTSTTTSSTSSTTTTIPPSYMILTFNIANDGDSLTLPFSSGPSSTVYWGDGSSDLSGTHTYATAGNYDVTLTGTSGSFNFGLYGNSTNKAQLRDIKQWGTFIQAGSWRLLFNQCGNLTGISATDSPSFGSETNIGFMFGTCTSLGSTTTNMNNWDVSGITNMESMFVSCTSFNANIGNWNVSNVTNMGVMFNAASAFNQNISSWNVGSVTNMTQMFAGASSFNQPLNSWNVSNVTSMYGLFAQANSFNQPIGSWDVSNVTDMTAMFNSNQAFNQDISTWDVSSVTGMNFMFYNATAFNQDLSPWCVTLIPSEPYAFADFTPAWGLPKPVWGTCPSLPLSINIYAGSGGPVVCYGPPLVEAHVLTTNPGATSLCDATILYGDAAFAAYMTSFGWFDGQGMTVRIVGTSTIRAGGSLQNGQTQILLDSLVLCDTCP